MALDKIQHGDVPQVHIRMYVYMRIDVWLENSSNPILFKNIYIYALDYFHERRHNTGKKKKHSKLQFSGGKHNILSNDIVYLRFELYNCFILFPVSFKPNKLIGT